MLYKSVAIATLAFANAADAQHLISTRGGGGPNEVEATSASIDEPIALARDSAGNVYVATFAGHRVFKITTDGVVHVAAGTGNGGDLRGLGGQAVDATLTPEGIALDRLGNLYISAAQRVLKVDATTGIITSIAGTGAFGSTGDGGLATAATIGNGAIDVDPHDH